MKLQQPYPYTTIESDQLPISVLYIDRPVWYPISLLGYLAQPLHIEEQHFVVPTLLNKPHCTTGPPPLNEIKVVGPLIQWKVSTDYKQS